MTTKLRAASFQDNAITTAKIAANAVTSAKIPANAIGNSELDLAADYALTGTVSGAGGGNMELVSKVTSVTTDLTALVISLPETTDFEYLKLIINLKSETGTSGRWKMVVRNTADNAFDTGSTDYRYMYTYNYNNGSGAGNAQKGDVNGASYIEFNEANAGDGSDDFETFHLVLDMYHTVGTSKFPRFNWQHGMEKRHNDAYTYNSTGSAMCSTAIGLDQIKLNKNDGSEFTNQGYTLYKVIK